MRPDPTRLLDPETVESVRSLAGDDPGFLADLVETFAADAPDRLAAIRDGLERGDAEAVRRAAHALKSSAGSIGALALQLLAQDAEHAARRGDLDQARAALEQLERNFGPTLDALRREAS